jgi:phosphoadenosine phosphosulfate reductase
VSSIDDLNRAIAQTPHLDERLRRIAAADVGPLVFTTSFGLEDQLLLDALVRADVPVRLVTLDTGRLFAETLDLWADTERHYDVRIAAVMPDASAIEALVARDGPLGFRQSVGARHACCDARKVRPLARALEGAGGWLTGLRADQSGGRANVPFAAHDPRGLIKLAPLADWSRADCEDYASANGVPLNPLHARGFPSIGCAPCTRAVASGEDERAGRWWWERDESRECGLHVDASGRLVRAHA